MKETKIDQVSMGEGSKSFEGKCTILKPFFLWVGVLDIPIRARSCEGELHMTIYETATEVRQTVMNITHTHETRTTKQLTRITPNINLTHHNYRYFMTITGHCCWKLWRR